MQVLLVRHAQPKIEHNPGGPADPGLSELGHQQAARLGLWLAHEPVDLIVTSPKRRAIETVSALIETPLPHEIVAEFDEIDRLSNWYYPTEMLATHGGEYWDAIMRQDWAGIGWDPPAVFSERVISAWEALLERAPGDVVVLGCHGGVVRGIISHVLGIEGHASIDISYTSVSRVEVQAGRKPLMQSINETAHLEGTREFVTGRLGHRPE